MLSAAQVGCEVMFISEDGDRQRIPLTPHAPFGPLLRPKSYTIVYVDVFDELPSPAAGLLWLARDKAGLTQAELARRAGVPASMVSAYEHDRRQPRLPTLLRLLKAAGYELRMHLEPYDDHDEVLAAEREQWSSADRDLWDARNRERIDAGNGMLAGYKQG
ncbi:MAG: helix-turn-helix transcriptional regulator [Acidimicrobiales bacterium]